MTPRALVAVAALLATSVAAAQPAPTLPPGHPAVAPTSAAPATAPAMPPGHPPVGSATAPSPAPGMPPGHPPVGSATAPSPAPGMPPGHPAVGSAAPAMPGGHPPIDGSGKPGAAQAPPLPEDTVDVAGELPKGTIEAQLLDADERPISGADVRLGIMFQKIAEGESRSEKHLTTGPDGIARFDGLAGGSNYSYRVTTKNGPGEFASTPFPLSDKGGMRVRLHVFPVVQDVEQSMVGMRGIFYIETRDDVFSVEGLFRVMNLGRTAWVPRDVVVTLPDGFKAFSAGESMFDSRFEVVDGRGAKLAGTFPPGQRDLNFRFHVPKAAETTAVFRIGPAPRTVELRVIAIASKAMGLDVEGFEPAQAATGPSGDPVLVTRKLAGRGDVRMQPFVVTLTGLTVPGPGRWVAVLIAFGIAAAGGLAAAGKWRVVSNQKLETDRARACDLLLDELVQLTRARERGEIGPQTHEQTRRTLVDALSRIGLPKDAPRRAKRSPKPVRA